MKDSTGIFFLPSVLRSPRTECGCHAVALIRFFKVTPPGRLSRSRILAVLLPRRVVTACLARVALRARLGLAVAPAARCFAIPAILAGDPLRLVAVGAGLALGGATWARRFATRAFFTGVALLPIAGAGPFFVCSG